MKNSTAFAMLLLLVMVLSGEGQNWNITSRKKEISKNSCDLYTGKWVYDSSYPLYDASSCPFFEKQFGCEKNGRPDKNYLKFRWKPSHCFFPRFDGADFLRRLRGKKILFVGDSISLNQWQSLACMLHTAVPQSKYTLARSGGLSEFTFPDYNTSLTLLRDGFLIKIVNKKAGRVLVLNSVSQGKSWKGFDILIFNTWHWWLHTGRKQPWDFIEDGNKLYKDMDRLVAYEKGLKTWTRWVDLHLSSSDIRVFFQGVSPDHMNALNWTAPNARTCIGVKRPLLGATNNGVVEEHPAERIVEKVIKKMEKPVELLRVTPLSQLRRDGHPGVYGIGRHRLPDCSHWCLPGVPDAWNHLLYASLYFSAS
uniref:Trichome birefringence-like N-terminal domain-containing protein n=2 Tax=Chenopodium quinoa TaxID=63459 RepID=A0A803M6C2_CHEQI